MTQAALSIRGQLSGVSILLTGATGYVGSLVLEQLLRCCPGVEVIYILCRGKKNETAEHRVRRLLHSGLFQHVRDHPELLAKVCLIKGDLNSLADDDSPSSPGLTPTSQEAGPASVLSTSLTTISGSPPAVAQIEELTLASFSPVPTLKHGGEGDVEMGGSGTTSHGSGGCWDAEGRRVRVATVADLMRRPTDQRLVVLHCAARIALEDPIKVTLSHNYVGTERLLSFVRRLPSACGFVHVSSAYVNILKQFLPEGTVHERLYPLMFGDTQCLGKHLTEELVRDAHCARMPVAIVRPSLVGAVAGKPYPGFVGNLAGPSGGAVAWILGFFDPDATSLSPWNHLDCVPGDVASSVVIAAAAALLAGHDTSTCPNSQPGMASSPPHGKGLAAAPGGAGSGVHGSSSSSSAPAPLMVSGSAAVQRASPVPVAVYHAASSCINPCSHHEASKLAELFYTKHPTRTIKLGRNMRPDPDRQPVAWKAKLAKRWLAFKVGIVCALLSCFGQDRTASRLQAGHVNFVQQVQSDKNNHRLFFDVRHVEALEGLLPREERDDFTLTWRGDWVEYGYTYMAAVVKLFLGQPVPRASDHHFVHVPSRHVA